MADVAQVHMVHFDSSQNIQQIRLYWDQGSLLKHVDVIGGRARNWPIRDGKDQAKLIATSVAGTMQSAEPGRPSAQTTGNPDEVVITTNNTTKPRSQSKNVTRDPHASLALFAPREEQDEDSAQGKVIRPYAPAAAKPPPRDYHDLFVGNDSDASPQAKARATSPKKENAAIRAPKSQSANPPPRDYHDLFVGNDSDASPVQKKGEASSPKKEDMTPRHIAPKGGAGKNYQPSRLFENIEGSSTPGTPVRSPDKYRQPDPKKYNHFDFGDGDDAKPMPARPKSKHQNNWDFEDFTTPQKVTTKDRGQDAVRHFGWEDDEPVMDSPMKHPAVAKARPDSKSNFEFQDDGTPAGERRPAGHPRGVGNVRADAGMYANNLFDEDGTPASPQRRDRPLSTVTNLKSRHKDFDSHWDMTDESPGGANETKQGISEARKKVVSQMGAQWDATDGFTGSQHDGNKNNGEGRINPITGDKENMRNGGNGGNQAVGIKSGGDGMGGKKGSGRSWGFGDDSDEDGPGGKNAGNFRASKIQQKPKDSGFWDF